MCRCRSFGEHTSHARSQTQAHNSLWCSLLHLPPLYANRPCGETDFSENLCRRWGTSGRPSRPHLWQQLHQVLHRQPQLPKAGVEINFLKVEYDSSSTVFRNLWCLAQIPRFWIQIWASAGEIWLSTRPKYFMRFQLFSEIGAKITNSTSPQMHVWTKNGVLQAWPSDLVVLCTQCLKIMISSLGRSALLSHHSHLHPIHMRLRLHHWVLLLRLRDLL